MCLFKRNSGTSESIGRHGTLSWKYCVSVVCRGGKGRDFCVRSKGGGKERSEKAPTAERVAEDDALDTFRMKGGEELCLETTELRSEDVNAREIQLCEEKVEPANPVVQSLVQRDRLDGDATEPFGAQRDELAKETLAGRADSAHENERGRGPLWPKVVILPSRVLAEVRDIDALLRDPGPEQFVLLRCCEFRFRHPNFLVVPRIDFDRGVIELFVFFFDVFVVLTVD